MWTWKVIPYCGTSFPTRGISSTTYECYMFSIALQIPSWPNKVQTICKHMAYKYAEEKSFRILGLDYDL